MGHVNQNRYARGLDLGRHTSTLVSFRHYGRYSCADYPNKKSFFSLPPAPPAFATEPNSSNMSTTTRDTTEATSISGVMVPDSKLAREATELVRDTESPLLFNHSTRVYYFGSLAGKRRGLKFDPELLYIGAMFHDMGLTPQYSSKSDRFEVDGANAARAFLRQHNISPAGDRYGVDSDCTTHYAGNSTVHASGGCAIDQRCRDGCSRNRLLGILRR